MSETSIQAEIIRHSNTLIDAFNRGDWNTFRDNMGDLVYFEPCTGRSLQGVDYLTAMHGWKQAFPDLTGEVISQVATADTVVTEVVWDGTHDGVLVMPDGEAPPTGNRATVPGVLINSYDDGVITGTNHYFDLLTVLRAAGAA